MIEWSKLPDIIKFSSKNDLSRYNIIQPIRALHELMDWFLYGGPMVLTYFKPTFRLHSL